jgi:hypothetical protein
MLQGVRGQPDIARAFLRWSAMRAALHRGWWLVTAVYLVVDARLDAAGLVSVAVAQSLTAILAEVPVGVFADTVGRKRSLLVAHALMGTAMLATGLVTDAVAVVATQMLWGLSWNFASGADVALLSDELGRPDDVSAVLVRAGRAELVGAAAGIAGFGALASTTGRGAAMVLAGAGMLLLGGYVAARFREVRFTPVRGRRWSAGRSVLVGGWGLARRSRGLLVLFGATFLAGAALDASGRLTAQRLIDAGFPAEPLLWFSALSVSGLLLGWGALRVVQARAAEPGAVESGLLLGCATGAVGLVGLAVAGHVAGAAAAVLLTAGVAAPLTRTLVVVLVNRRAERRVRATVHSLLAQAEYSGKVVLGAALAAVAGSAGSGPALLTCAGLFAGAAGLVAAARRVPA